MREQDGLGETVAQRALEEAQRKHEAVELQLRGELDYVETELEAVQKAAEKRFEHLELLVHENAGGGFVERCGFLFSPFCSSLG